MAEATKRIKISQIPDATNTDGFKAFGIKVNTDGTVDNVKVPMGLLKSPLTPEQIDEIVDRIDTATDGLLSNYIGFEIDEDMNLIMSSPDNYEGPEFVLEDGILKVLV